MINQHRMLKPVTHVSMKTTFGFKTIIGLASR